MKDKLHFLAQFAGRLPPARAKGMVGAAIAVACMLSSDSAMCDVDRIVRLTESIDRSVRNAGSLSSQVGDSNVRLSPAVSVGQVETIPSMALSDEDFIPTKENIGKTLKKLPGSMKSGVQDYKGIRKGLYEDIDGALNNMVKALDSLKDLKSGFNNLDKGTFSDFAGIMDQWDSALTDEEQKRIKEEQAADRKAEEAARKAAENGEEVEERKSNEQLADEEDERNDLFYLEKGEKYEYEDDEEVKGYSKSRSQVSDEIGSQDSSLKAIRKLVDEEGMNGK